MSSASGKALKQKAFAKKRGANCSEQPSKKLSKVVTGQNTRLGQAII